MLYRSTDRRSRRGAPMQNLAHSASFESLDKDAPSKAGTKHLAERGIAVSYETVRRWVESIRANGRRATAQAPPEAARDFMNRR